MGVGLDCNVLAKDQSLRLFCGSYSSGWFVRWINCHHGNLPTLPSSTFFACDTKGL